MNDCLICGSPTKGKTNKYCSRDCFHKSKIRRHECVCQSCGKTFYTNNKSYIRLGRLKHCSDECKNRKYSFNEDYFSGELSSEKLETLGQIIAIGQIKNFRTVKLLSNKETLDDINKKLDSNYKLQKLKDNKWKFYIHNEKFVSDLLSLGLTNFPLKQDVPRNDLWDGLKKTHCYRDEEGFKSFVTNSSKIANWIKDKFKAEIFTRMYNEVDLHFSVIPIFIVIWKEK